MSLIMLNVVMPNAVILSLVKLIAVMPSVVMLGVVILSVAAPYTDDKKFLLIIREKIIRSSPIF